tara:strand:+ start:268 stop:1143 length:876 start_codon:yes stop_codon:yes gene_type:complete
MNYKGIVLAGGTGSRLFPITKGLSKQLLPIYDKPMIYYPLSVLMLSNIRDIAIITTREDLASYKKLLGDGSNFGINLSFFIQEKPEGIAQSFLIAKDFIQNFNVSLILGDNIFYGQHFTEKLKKATQRDNGATIFGYHVNDPENFGVIEFDKEGSILNIEEKPTHPKSNYVVTGLYFYDQEVTYIAESIKPSNRGELEITSINNAYLENDSLNVETLGRGFSWLDTGTHDSLIEAGKFVQTIEQRQSLKVACLEEIAFNKNWITEQKLLESAENFSSTNYGRYLFNLVNRS